MLLHCTELGLDHVPRDFVSPHCPTPLQSHTSPPEAHGPLRFYVTVQDCHRSHLLFKSIPEKHLLWTREESLHLFAFTVFTFKNISQDENLLCEKLLNLAITTLKMLLVCAL